MSQDVQKLHEQMMNMSLGDLLILSGQAVNMKFPPNRLDIILKYVENAMAKRELQRMKERRQE